MNSLERYNALVSTWPDGKSPAWYYADQLEKDRHYKITIQGPKVRRTVVGTFVDVDEESVILLDERGRFQKMPVQRIILINNFKEPPW